MDDNSRRRGKQQVALIGKVFSFVVCCAFLLIVANPLAAPFGGTAKVLAVAVATAFGAFVITIVFTRLDGWSLEQVGAKLEWQSFPRMIFGFALGLLMVGIWAAATYIVCEVRWQRVPGTGFVSLAISVLTYLALAGREELAFHGYPLRRLHSVWGLWPAQLFIAALFAAEHLLGGAFWVDAIIGSALGSLLFGMASLATEGLAIPIGLHAAWNTGHWALGLKSSPGLLQPIETDGEGAGSYVAAMLIYAAVFGLATFAFWLLYRRRLLRNVI